MHKYMYYHLDSPTISDYEFDKLEAKWIEDGKKVGRTRTPPFWVGFDWNHPFAAEIVERFRNKGKKRGS